MTKMTLKFALLFVGLGLTISLQAQNVKGVVKDVNGEPIVGVSVVVEGTTIGTATGIDGDYSIDVPDASKDVLQFSAIGMKTVNIPVNGRKVIDAVLEDDLTVLEETV